MAPGECTAFLEFLEQCVSAPDSVPISNAAATCFIENLAGEPFMRRLFPELGPCTQSIYRNWSPASRRAARRR